MSPPVHIARCDADAVLASGPVMVAARSHTSSMAACTCLIWSPSVATVKRPSIAVPGSLCIHLQGTNTHYVTCAIRSFEQPSQHAACRNVHRNNCSACQVRSAAPLHQIAHSNVPGRSSSVVMAQNVLHPVQTGYKQGANLRRMLMATEWNVPTRTASASAGGSSRASRTFISAAPLRVNVMAMISWGGTCSTVTRWMMRRVMTCNACYGGACNTLTAQCACKP